MFHLVGELLTGTKHLPPTQGLSAKASNLNPAGGPPSQFDQIDDRIERLGLVVEILWEILLRRGVTEPELQNALAKVIAQRHEAELILVVCQACGSKAPEDRETCQICGAPITRP